MPHQSPSLPLLSPITNTHSPVPMESHSPSPICSSNNLNNVLSPLSPTLSFSRHNLSSDVTASSQEHGFIVDNTTPDYAIVDMNLALRRFGINPDNLNTVPVKQYKWNSFQPSRAQSPTPGKIEEIHGVTNPQSPTISQRVRGLLRQARHGRSNTHQCEDTKTKILTNNPSFYRAERTKETRSTHAKKPS